MPKRKRSFAPKRALINAADYHAIEEEVERLIAVLDLLAPDPDLEPSLAWTDCEIVLNSDENRPDKVSNGDDRELDEADAEPSLGAPEVIFLGPYSGSSVKLQVRRSQRPELWEDEPERTGELSQATWAKGGGDDREAECEDEGAQCDDEGVQWAP